MAVSFVAAASGDGGASSATTATCTFPSSAQTGDVAVVIGCAERGIVPVISGVTNWTALINVADGTQMSVFLGWKAVESGDPGTTVTATVSTARRLAVGVSVYRGVNTGTVVTAVSSTTTSTANGSGVNDVTTPSVTPNADDAYVAGVVGWVKQSSPWTSVMAAASPATERVDDASTSTTVANAGVWIGDKPITGGGGVSQTGTTTNGDTNVRFFAATLAFSPSSAQSEAQAGTSAAVGAGSATAVKVAAVTGVSCAAGAGSGLAVKVASTTGVAAAVGVGSGVPVHVASRGGTSTAVPLTASQPARVAAQSGTSTGIGLDAAIPATIRPSSGVAVAVATGQGRVGLPIGEVRTVPSPTLTVADTADPTVSVTTATPLTVRIT